MKRNKHSKAEAFRYIVLAIQRQGNRWLNDSLKDSGLTASQAEVIRILADWKSLSLKELGKLLICETGSPSRLLERMNQDGLVEKIVDPKDSRYLVLQLTAKGLEKAKMIENIEEQLYDQLIQIYSDAELGSACALLMRFIKDQPVADTLARRGLVPK